MNVYRFYLYSAAGITPVCVSIHSDTDMQARRTAFQLSRDRQDVHRIEAWRDADIAFRLNRNHIIAEQACYASVRSERLSEVKASRGK